MADSVTLKVDLRELNIFFGNYRRGFEPAIMRGLRKGLDQAAKLTRKRFFRHRGKPRPLLVVSRTGRLERSLRRTAVKRDATGRITGGIEWSGPQAAILEFGGVTRAHWIFPKRGRALRWLDRMGKAVFAKKVFHPGSRFEPRHILSRGLAASLPKIIRAVDAELGKIAAGRKAG